LTSAARDAYKINHQGVGFMTNNPDAVESAIAVPETTLLSLYEAAGLEVPTIFPGDWSGGVEASLSHQDICSSQTTLVRVRQITVRGTAVSIGSQCPYSPKMF
jgi:hypothetical protein